MVSRNLKRRHLTKPQRDVVIAKLRSMPQWANASNRAIAKEIGVDEATVRRQVYLRQTPQMRRNTQSPSSAASRNSG